MVPVPLNFRLAPPEWEYIVTDAGCRLAVVHEDHAAALGAVLPADVPMSVLRDDSSTVLLVSAEIAEASAHRVQRDVSPDSVYHQMYTTLDSTSW